MAKLLKIFMRLIGGILEWSLILLIVFAIAIRSSRFQTYLGQQATAFLSKELNTRIHVEKVSLIFFDRLALDGVIILDQKKDTIASVSSILVTLNSFDNSKKTIGIDELKIKKGVVRVSKNKPDGEFNFQFLIDYFDSGKPKPKSEPYKVTLSHLHVQQLDFKFDDHRKDYVAFGMDYNHMHFKNFYLSANLQMKKSGGIESFIKHMSFREKSGFEMDRFSSQISFDKKGLRTKYLRIVTPKSKIYFSKLSLNVEKQEDFSEFVDKVVFDASMQKSSVSLSDISYFATNLEGMKQKIIIEGEISKHIKDLKLDHLKIATGEKTRIEGSFNLPDFREFDQTFFNERIKYAYIDFKDIEAILLPVSSKERHLKLDASVNRLKHVQLTDFRVDGFYEQFVVKSDLIKTALGSIEMGNGVMFTENKANSSFTFEKSLASDYDVKIDSFLLGQFLADKTLGSLSGQFDLKGEIFSSGKIDFNSIQGNLDRFDYMDYAYQGIEIKEGKFVNKVFDGLVDVKDDNLNLTYHGSLDFNTQQQFHFDIDIVEAVLDNLNLADKDRTKLHSSFEVDVFGTNVNDYSGRIKIKKLFYQVGDKKLDIPELTINMDRSVQEDILIVDSEIAYLKMVGKANFATITDELNNQLNKILPAIFKAKTINSKAPKNKFTFDLEAKNLTQFLDIFLPDLSLANGTQVNGSFDGYKNEFNLNATSSEVKYQNIVAKDLTITQLVNDSINVSYRIGKLNINDSLSVNDATFVAIGDNGEINSQLKWNPGTENETYFSWKTIVNDINSYFFNLNPSYFAIKHHKWDIVNNSQILLAPDIIQIENFKMQRDQQYLSIDGSISRNKEDILSLVIKDLQLEDFVPLLGSTLQIKGELNGVATISDPYNDISFKSNAAIRDLQINGEEIGDINLNGNWGKASESIDLNGELFYKKNKTFNFDGTYYLTRLENSLDFDLKFDYTDLQFANAFMDPTVVTGIRGLMNGELKVNGTLEAPEINGKVGLFGGNAKVEMFGVNFGFNGDVLVDKEGIYINNMPILDEEGNAGSVIGTVLHNNFQDWNVDLYFNLLEDAFTLNNMNPKPLEQFLVMDTRHKEGEIYYGKAYVRGTANIFGYADNLQISVDLQTQKNTEINFPMYGTSDIEEDEFIKFKALPGAIQQIEEKYNLSGISMDLNFNVTPDATLKIIFNEEGTDVITAHGSGRINMELDQQDQVFMDGTFVIAEGSNYHFYMPPINKDFKMVPGGTIAWSGDPINAKLNLVTYAEVTTTLAEILPSTSGSTSAQPKVVKCMLTVTETLNEPLIKFDIEVPTANEAEKSAIAKIRAVPDDLNKQFFSLLLAKKFQPLDGSLSAGSGALMELVTNQINSLLDNMSKDVKFNVGLRNDNVQNETEVRLGVQKKFAKDRLIVKGSLGLENSGAGSKGQNTFIGDVNIEYLINQSGTFRADIFNESNDNTVIQEKNLGPFTQGAGLNYHEEFNNFQDFKLVQYFLDFFRKKGKKHYQIKRKRKQTPVPKAQ